MARDHDITGLMFYWFSGKGAPAIHLVMQKILELKLKDGQPDLPFFSSWANEPWTRRWRTGGCPVGRRLLARVDAATIYLLSSNIPSI